MGGPLTQSDKTLVQVLEENRSAIMAMPNVIGVGIGKCDAELCIKVMVSEHSDELEERLGTLLEGYPHRIEVTEPLQTLPSAREP